MNALVAERKSQNDPRGFGQGAVFDEYLSPREFPGGKCGEEEWQEGEVNRRVGQRIVAKACRTAFSGRPDQQEITTP